MANSMSQKKMIVEYIPRNKNNSLQNENEKRQGTAVLKITYLSLPHLMSLRWKIDIKILSIRRDSPYNALGPINQLGVQNLLPM